MAQPTPIFNNFTTHIQKKIALIKVVKRRKKIPLQFLPWLTVENSSTIHVDVSSSPCRGHSDVVETKTGVEVEEEDTVVAEVVAGGVVEEVSSPLSSRIWSLLGSTFEALDSKGIPHPSFTSLYSHTGWEIQRGKSRTRTIWTKKNKGILVTFSETVYHPLFPERKAEKQELLAWLFLPFLWLTHVTRPTQWCDKTQRYTQDFL